MRLQKSLRLGGERWEDRSFGAGKQKRASVFKITPSKPRLMTNAWVMQPKCLICFKLWELREGE